MKVDDLKNCTRPVVFDLKNEYARYSMRGTSFGFSNGNEFYIITLKHIIGSVEADDILISYSLKSSEQFREFLPINEIREFKNSSNDDDTDKYELVALRVEKSMIKPHLFDRKTFIHANLSHSSPYETYETYDMLLIIGYPDERNEVEYSIENFKNQRFLVTAAWKGKAIIEGCQRVEINTDNELESYSGLSGSPIFGVEKVCVDMSFVKLLGIMVRATKSSGIGYFIEVEGIKVLLDA